MWLVRVSEHVAAVDRDDIRLLDNTERARLDTFGHRSDRERFAVSHVALRRLLGAYLGGVDPATVTIAREACPVCGGPHGRPVLADCGPQFSLSHSDDLAIIAVADVAIGVDVEAVPEVAVADKVARALHPSERGELSTLQPGPRRTAFARCWARKEAYLKGTGHGLAGGLDTAYVGTGLVPIQPPGWKVIDLTIGSRYAAATAVAVTRQPPQVRDCKTIGSIP